MAVHIKIIGIEDIRWFQSTHLLPSLYHFDLRKQRGDKSLAWTIYTMYIILVSNYPLYMCNHFSAQNLICNYRFGTCLMSNF